jgi:hypothetical protein
VAFIAEDIVALVVLELVIIRLLVVATTICVLVVGTGIMRFESQLTESLA